MGISHDIAQGEEWREPGDPLMPLLFALGLHPALRAAQRRTQNEGRVFAYLDDVNVICRPERVLEVYQILEEELLAHSEIQHHGKTQSLAQGRQGDRTLPSLENSSFQQTSHPAAMTN